MRNNLLISGHLEYRIAGNFRGRKLYKFHCFVPISESFPRDCLKARWTVGGTSDQSMKVFSGKISFFHQFAKVFYLERFLLYGTFTVTRIKKNASRM